MGHDVSEAVARARMPFDVVRHENGSVGFITEVNINDCQPELKHQLSYGIYWFAGSDLHFAWWDHDDPNLTFHENLFEALASLMAHPFGAGVESFHKLLRR